MRIPGFLNICLVLLAFVFTLFPSNSADARYGYRSYSTYNSYRSYNRNSYYRQQQTYRNNQAIQRQNQISAQRQRQTQMRNQQAAARKYQAEQQQKIRNRQIAIQRNMKAHQQKAMQQQTKRLQLHREKMLKKQSGQLKSGGQLAKLQKNIQKQQLLREQKKFKERQKKLDRLAKQRKKKQKNDKLQADREKAFTLAALTAGSKGGFQPVNFQPKTLKEFKSNRLTQGSKSKTVAALDKSRLGVKSKVEKANQFKKRLFSKAGNGGGGNKKPPNNTTTGDGEDGKPPKKLTPVFTRAAQNFQNCHTGACNKIVEKTGTVSKKRPFWTSTNNKSAVENAFGHYKKHKGEFPEYQNAKQYVEGAQKFLNSPPQRHANQDTS